MKVLVHMCCGPCSVYPIEVIREKGFDAEGFFYNPNIHPIDEYERRQENVKILAEKINLKVNLIDGFNQKLWENYKGDEESRCRMCYDVRMEQAAKYAKENTFDAFTTTLLVSPYQKHEVIIEICKKYSKKIKFWYKYP